MSLLNQLFNRGVLGAKCKTCLNLAIARIKLLQNKRDVQLKLMRKEIAQFLQAGQEAIARIRVEHVIREQNVWAAYEIIELFCEFILARVPILENQRTCPPEMRESIASIIFAAPRCSDLPDLLTLRNLFAAKYGKEFIAAASELRPDSSVNRTIIEKLSVYAPSGETKLSLLKEIAREYNLEWDSSQTEAEFSKKPEDLLNGPKPVPSSTHGPIENSVSMKAHSNGINGSSSQTSQVREHIQSPIPTNSVTFWGEDSTIVSVDGSSLDPPRPRPSDVLERAQAAIAAAGRATAMARAAAELANVKFEVPNVGEMKC